MTERRSTGCVTPEADGFARLPDFVGAVESGACDDVSSHGMERIGEGELAGQVELVVQGEELEDVGVWSVRARGPGPAQPRRPRAPLPCLSPGSGLGWVRPLSGMPPSDGSMPSVSAWVAGFPRGTSGSCTMSTSSAVSAGGAVQARAGEMLTPNSLPRCRSGMGVPWSKAGLVRVKFSGACRSGRAQTSVPCPACRLRSARPRGFAGMVLVPSLDAWRMGLPRLPPGWGCDGPGL